MRPIPSYGESRFDLYNRGSSERQANRDSYSFARSSAKQLSKAQGRIRELAEQNAELLRQLELLRRIPKKVPLPMLDSEILSDDGKNGRSERSGSFDGVVDPADKREDGSPLNPKRSGETPLLTGKGQKS